MPSKNNVLVCTLDCILETNDNEGFLENEFELLVLTKIEFKSENWCETKACLQTATLALHKFKDQFLGEV